MTRAKVNRQGHFHPCFFWYAAVPLNNELMNVQWLVQLAFEADYDM